MTRVMSRRSVLATVGVATASAGCVGRARNIAGRQSSAQLVLEIRTVPADDDPNAVRIARHLSEHLDAVGVDSRVDTMAQADLQRSVLLNHDFDIYVGQYPEVTAIDPDMLYGLLHSRFTAETGWQNPFGLTELAIDELLEEQRRVDDERRLGVLGELQETLCELQPFTVVAFPDALTAYREGTYSGWHTSHPTSPDGILRLSRIDPDDEDGAIALRLATTDTRITENFNPIAVEYRRHGTFTSLLYDPLARRHDGEQIPWLARGWRWVDDRTIRLELRAAEWHDGEPLTAEDVAFTYNFLHDTSMGGAESPVPTPRFRSRSSLVESAEVIDQTTVELNVGNVNKNVGERALELPILPRHVWIEYTELASIAGIAIDEETTEALVWNNDEPIGSGPLRFVEATAESEVTFERNPDHFLQRMDESVDEGSETDNGGGHEPVGDAEEDESIPGTDAEDGDETDDEDGKPEGSGDGSDTDGGGTDSEAPGERLLPAEYVGKPSFERLVLQVVPSDIAAVQLVGDGLADGTVSNLGPDAVPRIGREANARLVSNRSAAFYHVGYNVRRAPLSNPRFRAVLASLFDKKALINDVFQGYAVPATSPLAASPEFVPERLRWDEDRRSDPVYPFARSNGELDEEAVREAFREAGYRYNEAAELLARDQ